MRTTPIEIDEARVALLAAVETQGRDFIYNPYGIGLVCYYEPVGSEHARGPADPRILTGCLIGVALGILGEYRQYGQNVSTMALHDTFTGMMSRDVAQYFRMAQVEQDSGRTWGVAYEAAERWYANKFGGKSDGES